MQNSRCLFLFNYIADNGNYSISSDKATVVKSTIGDQAPLRSPNPDTASQNGYNVAAAGAAGVPQRRTFLSPTTEGNKRELYAQGRPQAKDAAGSGANWYLGTKSERQVILQPDVESRLFFEGTVTATDMSRATDKREKDRVGIFGTGNSYAGSYGRVTSESIGRDLNPLGRGDGRAYLAGMLDFGQLYPELPLSTTPSGSGNSVNNCGCKGIGSCDQDITPGITPDAGFENPIEPPQSRTIMPDWNPWAGEKDPHWITGENQQLYPNPSRPGWWVVRPPHIQPFPPIAITPSPTPPGSSWPHPVPPVEQTPLPMYWRECDENGNCPPGYKPTNYPDPKAGMRCVCVPNESNDWSVGRLALNISASRIEQASVLKRVKWCYPGRVNNCFGCEDCCFQGCDICKLIIDTEWKKKHYDECIWMCQAECQNSSLNNQDACEYGCAWCTNYVTGYTC